MAWTPNVRIPDQQSKATPALAYGGPDGAQLHMVHPTTNRELIN